MSFYAAMVHSGADGRLTGFRSARNIIRIRTNDPTCAEAGMIGASNEQACS
jgi:hypothetical protein